MLPPVSLPSRPSAPIAHRVQMQSPSSKNMLKKSGKGEGKFGGEARESRDASSMISEGRLKELDWNGDGCITFKEFLFAFEGENGGGWCFGVIIDHDLLFIAGWVGIAGDDGGDEDEEED